MTMSTSIPAQTAVFFRVVWQWAHTSSHVLRVQTDVTGVELSEFSLESLESGDTVDAIYFYLQSFYKVCGRERQLDSYTYLDIKLFFNYFQGPSENLVLLSFTPDLQIMTYKKSLYVSHVVQIKSWIAKAPHCFHLMLSSTLNFLLHMAWHLSHSNGATSSQWPLLHSSANIKCALLGESRWLTV